MKLPPRKKTESIINRKMKMNILVQSLAIFSAVFVSFILGLKIFFVNEATPLTGARTMAFATLILAELFRAYSARSEHVSVFKLGIFTNRSMNLAVSLSSLLLLLVIYIPVVNTIFDNVALPLLSWIPILILAVIPFSSSDIYKTIKYRKLYKDL